MMDLGESLEETAKREVYEETTGGGLELLDVFSGKEFYLQLRNQDELYPIPLSTQLETLKDVHNNEIAEDLGYNYRRFLECYTNKE